MHTDRDSMSTPKRRRLGTGRILRPSQEVFQKKYRPIQELKNDDERCVSPTIPCNQVEYLCDSASKSSTFISSNLSHSPVNLQFGCKDFQDDVDLNSPTSNNCETSHDHSLKVHQRLSYTQIIQFEKENITDDMFQTKLEIPEQSVQFKKKENIINSPLKKSFRENIEESFNSINDSICKLQQSPINDKNEFFETKDSFLLDLKDTSNFLGENHILTQNPMPECSKFNCISSFYGLPLLVKALFKSLRNIEKFYDWQEECLNLDAIKNRKNLIYALPTSGGKTLVAEVLMLREVLNRKKNTLFILPFVAIVQEKIWALSPFAVKLDFLVEEYAAGKGHIPPKKRRQKNSIYIATIEKGLALVRSLIELNRLHEIGLIVVDELHLIGEPGRGSTLETLLSTVIFANQDIQIVGMSATIGNLPELATYLDAVVFERQFRPVELTEYVKLGDMLHRMCWTESGLEIVPDRQIKFDYSEAARARDPDWLGGLAGGGAGPTLVFCATRRAAENAAGLLADMQRREILSRSQPERQALYRTLVEEGSAQQWRCVRAGVAFHHAALPAEERSLLEQAFRCGTLVTLCCTSTLAAGVNLPAARVVIRTPRVGRDPLTLAPYRQMVGRAGRAQQAQAGESILMCPISEWGWVRGMLCGGVAPARSGLAARGPALLLGGAALRLATTRDTMRALMRTTLLAVQAHSLNIDIDKLCDESIASLLQDGALKVARSQQSADGRSDHAAATDDYEGCVFTVSKLGNAAVNGGLELTAARHLLEELEVAARGLVLATTLHLLYLVCHEPALRPDYRHYYTVYSNLNEECLHTANVLGITEKIAVKMMTGKRITNIPESVLTRFYGALILHDLWNHVPLLQVCDKYGVGRGPVQQITTAAAARATSAVRVCEQVESRWPFRVMFTELAARLKHCAEPELAELCDLPNVKRARALQLKAAGYGRVELLARADVGALAGSVRHLTRAQATHLVSAARLMLIEKVENLRAEAEEVMEGLKV